MAFFYLFLRKLIARKAKERVKKKLAEKKSKYKGKASNFVKKRLHISEESWIYKKWVRITTEGTFENFVYTSFLGFIGGVLLTYMFFFFFVFQMNFSLTSATILCSIFGVILTLGLAYSMKVRCIVFLLLPQFCSKRGRQALMAYAFILTLTGPAKNTLHNIGVLSESLACAQDQLKEAVQTIMDLIKQPFYTLKDSVSKIIKSVKMTVKRIKQALLAIKRLVLSILSVIKAVFQWLASIVNICNKTLGTPFDRCSRVFEGAIVDCRAKLGPVFNDLCSLVTPVKAVCYVLKPLDLVCGLVSYVADSIVEAVEKQIRKFTTEMRTMFYVKVKFSHSFKFETNQSRTFEQVSSGIITEIRQRTEEFLVLFDWMSFFTTFFVFFILLRVYHYRYKWLTSDRFDNRYITKEVREIDDVRRKHDKETLLPLGYREKNKYAPLTAIRLVKAERMKLAKSTVFLLLASFKFLFHIAADYSLYWMLDMIRYHGRIELKVQRPNSVGIYVSGTGFLAELYKSIIKAFSPLKEETYVNTIPCLPEPTPPDFDRYIHILMLIVFCWTMTFAEPYGLRLRHVVLNYYHPERARQRAVWLYNHIIRSRGSFLKFARRQLRRKFGVSKGQIIEKVTFVDRMYATCPSLNLLFPREQNVCLLCGSVEKKIPHIKCPTPNCVGLYCGECFSDLQNLCTICKSPLEYGDYSDLSEERDSSDFDATFEEPDQSNLSDPTGETDSDVESLSSYSYQYESPSGEVPVPERTPSRDVEAQKMRDDVTTQIFDYVDSDSEDESSSASTMEFQAAKVSTHSAKNLPVFYSDLSSEENISQVQLDKGRETESLLTQQDKSRFRKFVGRLSSLFRSRKSLIRDDIKPKKRKPVEEMKDILKKQRSKSREDPLLAEESSSSSESDETIIFLNLPTGGISMDFSEGDYLIINENFTSNSESEESGISRFR